MLSESDRTLKGDGEAVNISAGIRRQIDNGRHFVPALARQRCAPRLHVERVRNMETQLVISWAICSFKRDIWAETANDSTPFPRWPNHINLSMPNPAVVSTDISGVHNVLTNILIGILRTDEYSYFLWPACFSACFRLPLPCPSFLDV